MGNVFFDLKGITPLRRKLNGQFANVRDGALAAIHKPVTMVMADSQQQVPKDTGALASSAFVVPPRIEGDEIVIDFGYGGPNMQVNSRTGQTTDAYAFIVHEDMSAKHPTGKAKYLEDPLNQHAPNVLAVVGHDISRFFR